MPRHFRGVKGVVTAQDLPTAEDRVADLGEGAVNLKYLCDNIFASDKVLYKGHAVAAVAATNPHIAEEACTLIDVAYEVLPPVLEVRHAMEADAPLLHDNLKTTSMGDTADEPSNVASHIQHKLGDPEKDSLMRRSLLNANSSRGPSIKGILNRITPQHISTKTVN